jgi:hypothetical protein
MAYSGKYVCRSIGILLRLGPLVTIGVPKSIELYTDTMIMFDSLHGIWHGRAYD